MLTPHEPAFPARVRIGFTSYGVEPWTPRAAASAARYGESAHVERVIRVDRQHGPVQTAETLLHEIVHAIKDVSPVRCEEALTDEQMACLVSQGITQIMRDNPEARAWLSWAWAQDD